MDNALFKETLLSSETIHRGRIVTLREDTVQLSSGLIAKREIVEHHRAVVVLPVTDLGEVVLVRQFRRAAERVMLEVPAGLMNETETSVAAAHRELGEETGYQSARMVPMFEGFPTPGFCTEYMYFFVASGLSLGTAHTDEDEIVTTVVWPVQQVVDAIRRREIVDIKTIAAIGWYQAYGAV